MCTSAAICTPSVIASLSRDRIGTVTIGDGLASVQGPSYVRTFVKIARYIFTIWFDCLLRRGRLCVSEGSVSRRRSAYLLRWTQCRCARSRRYNEPLHTRRVAGLSDVNPHVNITALTAVNRVQVKLIDRK